MSLVQDPSTGTAANVTNPSTSPIASQSALIVAISPNSATIPTSNLSVGPTGSPVPADGTLIGGTDGTNLVALRIKDASTASVATDPSLVVALSPNSPLPAGSSVIGAVTQSGTWTNTVTQATASNLNATVVGAGTAGTPSGGVVSVQGVSGGTVLPISAAALPLPTGAATASNQTTLGTQTTEINDGTHTATIKAASTAAVATDTSLVVALSPNSPIPTGANVIGAVTQSGTWTATVTQTTAANLNATVAQGAPNTTANSWPTTVTDGTHGPAAVKAASTAAVATDPALVVAISPNNTISTSNLSVGLTGTTTPTSATLVGGTDGTNLIALKIKDGSTAAVAADPSLVVAFSPNSPLPAGAAVIGAVTQSGTWTTTVTQATAANLNATVVGVGTAGTPSGGVVSVQGVSGGTVLPISATALPLPTGAATASNQTTLGTQTTEINDGTHTASIKAASTAASATDTSLVVALSPNSSIPTGANVIGAVTQSGTWTATVTQATAANLNATVTQGPANTLANAWSTKITDATNGPVAVKPASTAAVATDPALVVAISPNNTISTSNLSVGATGSPVPADATLVGGTDGTNLVALKIKGASTAAVAADPSLVVALSPNSPIPTGANVIGAVTQSGTWTATVTQATAANLNATVVGAGTAGTPTGGVVSVQGVSGGTVLPISATSLPLPTGAATASNQTTIGTQTTQINDGTRTATIKAASTASVAGDTSLVVALSPNSPIPTGSNVIGAVTQSGTWTSTVTQATAANLNATVAQGTAASLANAWSTKITDATNGPAAVKAASTAAAAADPSLVVALSPNSPPPMFADRQVSGTLGALSASLTINTQGTSTLILDVSGTWVGTIQVQVSFDNGATYPGTISAFTLNTFYPGAGGLTANGIYYVATGGITSVKLVMTAYTSGSASVEMNAGAGSQYAKLLSFTTDGTNVAAVKAASTAAVAADPALVTAFSPNSPLPSGGNTIGAVTIPGLALPFNIVGNAAQGAATSGAPVLVAGSDGTNVQTLRVKPASTAAVATDPALVVAVSPNNSVSTTTADVTGTGALGALNASVQVNTAGLLTAGFQLAAGTLIGTIVPEVSFDGGTTWNPTNFYNIALGAVASIVFGSANTATAASIVGLGGAGLSRVRVSAYTSGTANVTVRATTRDESDIALLQAISTNTGASATDFTQTGTITATNGTVVVNGQGVYTVSASITGTWAGTLVAEGQLADNSWVQVPMYLVNTTLPYLAQFTTTVNGTFLITGGGYLNIRIRASVYTSGTVAVALDGSLAQQTNFAAQLGAWNLTDRTATGNLAALNATAVVNTGGCSTVGFDVTGTWVGTIIFEAQTGDSTWWAQDAWVQSGTSTSGGISSNGQGVIPCGGFSQVRLRMTPYTSGTAVISLNAGAGSNVQQATIVGSPLVLVGGETPVGSAPFGNPVLVGGINSAGNTESLGVTVDRAAMTGGVQTGVPIIGASSGVGRLISLDRFGHVTPGYQTLMAMDPIEGSTVNSWLWAQSTATMTIAQTTGLLVLNNSNTTTTTTYAILTSNRQFPITNQASIAMSYRALVTQTTNAVQEIGFGAPTTTTAIINNGAFFRIKTSGQIFLVTSYNGTETVSAQVATLVNTSYYLFLVELSDNGARFIMEDANGVPLVDQSVTLTLSTPDKAAVSHLPAFARVYTTGAAGAAPKITISSFQAWQFSINSNKPWQQQLAASGRVSVINPTTFAQTTSSMTAAPATETPSNTAGGYNNLGGDYAVALTTASENPLSVFGFQIPSPYTFYLTSLIFSVPFITTTIGVTGVPVIEWLAVANCSSANINTGGGQKFPLGLNFLYTSATQAAGTFCTTQGNLTWNPDVPIVCLPGTFLHLAYKVFITSAAATPGVTRGSVYVDGYFE